MGKGSSVIMNHEEDFEKVAWNDGYVYFWTSVQQEFRDAQNRCEDSKGELAWAGMTSLETRQKIVTALGKEDLTWTSAWFGLTLEDGKWKYDNDVSDNFH